MRNPNIIFLQRTWEREIRYLTYIINAPIIEESLKTVHFTSITRSSSFGMVIGISWIMLTYTKNKITRNSTLPKTAPHDVAKHLILTFKKIQLFRRPLLSILPICSLLLRNYFIIEAHFEISLKLFVAVVM